MRHDGFVYMMSDKPRGVIYIGVTSDLHGRVWEHRNDIHQGLTAKYKAKNLVWLERHPNIVLAIQREKSLKRYRREWKTNLIEELNPTWLDLYERIDEIENVYRPHPSTRMWGDNIERSADPRDKPEDDALAGQALGNAMNWM
ncbi:GIY-YIG nuclease family protein [Chelativorans sp. AA-79]|uniref:GIY-YIG nuclease family protein n=1 Tax=Chelativorans sp. AA-79 TaxID=3028735 RepID=UPI0023F836E6|nr:GIY-YIG nuclease family protein [Chelativorans sp. AA-79]WEX07303.1 GIY-YIG nuclease family protein [Chelativorans sp. AA-79]